MRSERQKVDQVNSSLLEYKFATKKKDIRLNIIQSYAPTNDVQEERKEEFYQQLEAVIDRGGAKDMTILMGDFNAKIRSDNTGCEDIMGTHGLGQMNENAPFPHGKFSNTMWLKIRSDAFWVLGATETRKDM